MNMSDTRHLQSSTSLRGELRLDEPMARHSSWRAGGRAKRTYTPADLDDLACFLKGLPADEPITFLGLGSNTLVRDGGYAGTVVLMHSARRHAELDGGLVYADAGVACPKVARFAALNGRSGAEFLAGIPGSMGGALAMNAGCYGSETWDVVARVRMIDRNGQVSDRESAEFETGYRHCVLKSGGRLGEDSWFVGVSLALPAGDGEVSRQKIRELLERRIASQPLALPNAGSVFRNPVGDHAARLIEACGLKGYTLGAARVSEKHANFIVNPAGLATASEIEALISEVRERVRRKTGVDLHLEVRIIGAAR